MFRAGLVAVVTIAIPALLSGRPAHGQGLDSRPRPGPLALRAELGQLSGAAVGGEVRLGAVAGIRATAGANLILLIASDPVTHDIDSIDGHVTWQLGGELFLFPIHLAGGTEIGFSLAARFNSLLGTGGGVGIEVRRQLRERLGLTVGAGLAVYPDGEERVVERDKVAADADLNFPFGAEVQTGATVGLTHDIL